MKDNGSDPNAGAVSRGPSSLEKGTQALRLGAERPRITRLSRKVLAGGTALALLLVSGAVLWALRSSQPHHPSLDELYSTDHHTIADGLTALPKDYAGIARDVPQIGQPLPGGLARPMSSTEGQSAPIGLDAEQQRANQDVFRRAASRMTAHSWHRGSAALLCLANGMLKEALKNYVISAI